MAATTQTHYTPISIPAEGMYKPLGKTNRRRDGGVMITKGGWKQGRRNYQGPNDVGSVLMIEGEYPCAGVLVQGWEEERKKWVRSG